MSSVIYNSCLYGVFRSIIHFDSDGFKMMLVTPDYIPDKIQDKTRSDVLDFEIPSGNGYTKDGVPVDASIVKDGSNDRVEVILGGATWEFASISAGGAVYYKSRGSASLDDLICYIQFSQPVASLDGKFSITSSRIRIQN